MGATLGCGLEEEEISPTLNFPCTKFFRQGCAWVATMYLNEVACEKDLGIAGLQELDLEVKA